MPPIQLLPPSVAERIAAGEVIDRPAAAVKELVENAIDAGATEIVVEAQGGGLRLIRIADNGCGIPASEIELAFRRHATSKLREIEDLDQVLTLGFRGEALASLAAVAEVTMISATEDRAAVRCSFRAGLPLERLSAARSRGTTVTVRELFSAMPARLKFMRGARTEAVQIGAVVRRYALARPGLRLTLMLEGHLAFRSEGSGELSDAMAAAYGDVVAAALMPVGPAETGEAKISGLISRQSLTRANRDQIALFVNDRYVRPRRLLLAIEEGYRPFLPRGRHAVAAIVLDVPPADLDVNVHPAKLDVRLRHESAVVAALTEAIRGAFGRYANIIAPSHDLTLSGGQRRLPGLSGRIAESGNPGWGWAAGGTLPASSTLPELRLLGQLHDSLIVAEAVQGFYLIDQHRAHERIIYERLQTGDHAEQQSLIEPAILELPGVAAQRFAERLDVLASLGFACEEFGPARFVLRAAPAGDDLASGAAVLAEVLQEAGVEQEDWRDRLLAAMSCRSAIRKGKPLTAAEARDLITRLGTVASPAVCPHGSPILLHVPEPFLARQFHW